MRLGLFVSINKMLLRPNNEAGWDLAVMQLDATLLHTADLYSTHPSIHHVSFTSMWRKGLSTSRVGMADWPELVLPKQLSH